MPLAQRGGFFVGTLALAALLVAPAAAETIESVTKPFYAKFGSP
jgi:hypothetical protein